MSALSDALTAAAVKWAWAASPLDGRIALWVYMDGAPLGLFTMTANQQERLRTVVDVRL